MKKIKKWFADITHKYSKTPWFRLETPGIDADAGVSLDISWNPAFISHLREVGFLGRDEQDMVRQFLLAITLPPELMGLDDGADEAITSDAHPQLTSDMNYLKR